MPKKLNINFTKEKEANNTISFLDILLNKSQNNITFKVYRKPKKKWLYRFFYSYHNNKIKRPHNNALWICNLEYLEDEFRYIEHSLKSLKYPKFFILNAREKKTLHIHSANKLNKDMSIIPITHKPISLSFNIHNKPFYDKLAKLGILIIQDTLQTIENLTNIAERTNNTTSHSDIYSIRRNNFDKYYIDETQRNLDKRSYKNRQAIKLND